LLLGLGCCVVWAAGLLGVWSGWCWLVGWAVSLAWLVGGSCWDLLGLLVIWCGLESVLGRSGDIWGVVWLSAVGGGWSCAGLSGCGLAVLAAVVCWRWLVGCWRGLLVAAAAAGCGCLLLLAWMGLAGPWLCVWYFGGGGLGCWSAVACLGLAGAGGAVCPPPLPAGVGSVCLVSALACWAAAAAAAGLLLLGLLGCWLAGLVLVSWVGGLGLCLVFLLAGCCLDGVCCLWAGAGLALLGLAGFACPAGDLGRLLLLRGLGLVCWPGWCLLFLLSWLCIWCLLFCWGGCSGCDLLGGGCLGWAGWGGMGSCWLCLWSAAGLGLVGSGVVAVLGGSVAAAGLVAGCGCPLLFGCVLGRGVPGGAGCCSSAAGWGQGAWAVLLSVVGVLGNLLGCWLGGGWLAVLGGCFLGAGGGCAGGCCW